MNLPEGLGELRHREVVHDRNVNELLGIVDNRQDSRQVV